MELDELLMFKNLLPTFTLFSLVNIKKLQLWNRFGSWVFRYAFHNLVLRAFSLARPQVKERPWETDVRA